MAKVAPEKLTAIHLAVEDQLIEMRDSRMWMWSNGRPPANGLVVRESDGSSSDLIRIGTRAAIEMILDESDKYDIEHPEK